MTATRRTASTAAAVLLTVAFAVLVSGFVRTSTAVYAAGRLSAVSAAWMALPDRAPGLTHQAAAATPGAAVLPTTVFVTDDAAPTPIRPLTALGVDLAAFTAATARSPSSPDRWRSCAATTRWVTASAAPSPGLPTQPYPVVSADGEQVALRVVAAVTDDSLPGDLLLPRAAVRAHDSSALTSAVYLAEPVDPPAGARVVDVAAWARGGPGGGPAGLARHPAADRGVGRLRGHRGGQHAADGRGRAGRGPAAGPAGRGDPAAGRPAGRRGVGRWWC
ncbi:hypothetical protein [Micromonospora cremea]|nr:hypothetical protein [Micromonospora cremea]